MASLGLLPETNSVLVSLQNGAAKLFATTKYFFIVTPVFLETVLSVNVKGRRRILLKQAELIEVSTCIREVRTPHFHPIRLIQLRSWNKHTDYEVVFDCLLVIHFFVQIHDVLLATTKASGLTTHETHIPDFPVIFHYNIQTGFTKVGNKEAV